MSLTLYMPFWNKNNNIEEWIRHKTNSFLFKLIDFKFLPTLLSCENRVLFKQNKAIIRNDYKVQKAKNTARGISSPSWEHRQKHSLEPIMPQQGRNILDFSYSSLVPSCPQSSMTMSSSGLSFLVGEFSIWVTTSMPSRTLPKMTCFPFKWGVGTMVGAWEESQSPIPVVMKNWEPFVFLPLLAMANSPGSSKLSLKFSSSNLTP